MQFHHGSDDDIHRKEKIVFSSCAFFFFWVSRLEIKRTRMLQVDLFVVIIRLLKRRKRVYFVLHNEGEPYAKLCLWSTLTAKWA